MIQVGMIIYLIAINVVTIIIYAMDKVMAKRGGWRVPESTLLLLAVVGGSIGAVLAMEWFHHKTLHAKFRYGIPAIIMIQVAIIGYIVFSIGE